ncbi:hypothetical protein Ancab_031195 [Ancistrocladus abbreviatus]
MDLFLFPLLFLLVLSYLVIKYLLPSKRAVTSKTSTSGGFKCYPLLGTIPEFVANRHRFLDWTTDVLSAQPTNTAVFYRPGSFHGVITANPLIVEYMLKTNFPKYPKGPRFISLLQDFLGGGIFNSDGESWRLQRKTASFEFNKRSLRNFVLDNVRSEIETRLVPLLKNYTETGQVLDLQGVLERFAFDNVCKVAFNLDPGCLRTGPDSGEFEFMRKFEVAATLSSGRFMYAVPNVWKIKKFFNIGSEKKLRESIRTVHAFADEIIRMRLEETSENFEDLLSRFIDKEGNSPEFLRDIVTSFILAGKETTSSGLSWFFWLLSLHPDVVEKIRSEIETVRSRYGKQVGNHTYDLDQLREMNYLHAAISESLRLYPPVPVDTKHCLEDDILPDGTMVKKGWFITYDTYAMGRMKDIWGEDCEKFRPERWMENGLCKQESPFRYPVFHAGPRICLGKEMAYIQMKSIAACVIEQFEVDVVGKDERPEYLLALTLRMKGGLPVRVMERK